MSGPVQHLLEKVLGAEIVDLSRILYENAALGQRYVGMSAVVLALADGRKVEVITGQSRTKAFELSPSRGPVLMDMEDPDPTLDPDDRFSLVPLTGERFDRSPPLPIKIAEVTEIWAGRGPQAFLVAIRIQGAGDGTGDGNERRLDLCVETDEVEIMTPIEMEKRLIEIARGYEQVEERLYRAA